MPLCLNGSGTTESGSRLSIRINVSCLSFKQEETLSTLWMEIPDKNLSAISIIKSDPNV